MKLGDHGAEDPEVQVFGRVPGMRCQQGILSDVHAACESDAPVDHQDLAVVPQVEMRDRARQECGEKLRDGDASLLQHAMDARTGVTDPYVVHEHADLDTAGASFHQRIDKLFADSSRLEDIAYEGDRFSGGPNGFEHGGVSFVSVNETIDLIADQQGALRDVPHDARELDEPSALASELAVQVRGRTRRLVLIINICQN